MKLPTNKIELATSTNDIRHYLNHVYLDVENKRLIATDGHIAAVLPCEPDDGDTSGSITKDAIKAARRKKSRIKCNDALVLDDGVPMLRPDLTVYPNVDRVIPEKGEGQIIRLDAKLLYNLAQALNGDKQLRIKIYIPADNMTAIRVESWSGDGYGAIMPLRVGK